LALVMWRLAASRTSGADDRQIASNGTLADTSAHASPVAATPLPAADTQPTTVAAGAPAAVDSSATPAAKLTIAAIKPIHVGDSAALRARLASDPKAKTGPISWSSSAPLVARVNSRTGRVVALKEGSATITGTSNGATGTITVRVLPGTVVQTGKPTVAQLITSEIKSTMHSGDTIRLTAAPLGAKGESLLDRKVAWQSTHPEVASVDAYGLVTARSAGTAEIVATSEQQTARIPLTVASRTITFTDAPAALRAGADRFANAIRDHDGRELAAVFFVDSPDDQKNLDWLLEKVHSNEANLRVTRTQPGRPAVREAEATSDVVFTLAWSVNGRNKDTKAKFRLRSAKNGQSWSIATLRALDRLE